MSSGTRDQGSGTRDQGSVGLWNEDVICQTLLIFYLQIPDPRYLIPDPYLTDFLNSTSPYCNHTQKFQHNDPNRSRRSIQILQHHAPMSLQVL